MISKDLGAREMSLPNHDALVCVERRVRGKKVRGAKKKKTGAAWVKASSIYTLD